VHDVPMVECVCTPIFCQFFFLSIYKLNLFVFTHIVQYKLYCTVIMLLKFAGNNAKVISKIRFNMHVGIILLF
jgi:hypothetical protein